MDYGMRHSMTDFAYAVNQVVNVSIAGSAIDYIRILNIGVELYSSTNVLGTLMQCNELSVFHNWKVNNTAIPLKTVAPSPPNTVLKLRK